MTGQDEQELRDRWEALGIRTDMPYPARVYDYLLGGNDNFAADREMGELSLRVMPELLESARANRKFLVRAVRFLRPRQGSHPADVQRQGTRRSRACADFRLAPR